MNMLRTRTLVIFMIGTVYFAIGFIVWMYFAAFDFKDSYAMLFFWPTIPFLD